MLFLLDAISTSIKYAHYKIFEVDDGVFYAQTNTKWKDSKEQPPTDFYLSKIKLDWRTDIPVSEVILDDVTWHLETFLLNRRQEREREERNKRDAT